MPVSNGSGVHVSFQAVLFVVFFFFTGALSQNETESHYTEADYYSTQPQLSASAPFGYRPGSATRTNSCQHIRAVPSNLRSSSVMKPNGLSYFYQKYTEAYGIPVLSSRAVSDDALRRACYTLRFLLAGHSGIRQSFYRLSGRVAVIGVNEGTTNIPEHSHLPAWWNQRARGLGATPHAPVSSGGEENVLCMSSDRYREDIYLHESVHGVHLLGAAGGGIPGWDSRLRSLYQQARSRGLWANTYSMSTPEEYFAEGTQSYFNVNAYSARPDGVRGPINTRAKLRNYDPQLYEMIREVFPCDNTYLKRCESNRAQERDQVLQMDCNNGGGGGGGGGGGEGRGACSDNNSQCSSWASRGECQKNPDYMHTNCKRSCNLCPTTRPSTPTTTTSTTTGQPTRPPGCTDAHTTCEWWASNRECERNPDFMHVNCKPSCNRCNQSTTTTTTTTTTTVTATTTNSNTNPTTTTSPHPPGTTAPPTTTTTTPTPTDCTDLSPHCGYWSYRGECERNQEYMHLNCRRSCNICASNCVDTGRHCEYWASTGECTSNPNYMNVHCRVSCELC